MSRHRDDKAHHLAIYALALCALTACGGLRFVDAPSANHSSRVDHLVIHFTGESFAESLRHLTQRSRPSVSAHYLVPEPGDPTYTRGRLRIHRLVDERRRAWHAGDSHWHGVEALNARSIGIEIVNESRCVAIDPSVEPSTPENESCVFRDYAPEQIKLVIGLARDILERHPDIDPVNVVGHGDVAPDRRVDPGPTFPWRTLYEHGIGAWYDDAAAVRYIERFEARLPSPGLLERALGAYGYRVEEGGEAGLQGRFALRAFQMHYRPADWSGRPDAETAAILFALIEKYRPEALTGLLAEHDHR
jgi:serine-type D-Ala-D-Ala carboxypeptidase